MPALHPVAFSGIRKAFARPDSGYGIIDRVSFDVAPGSCVSLMGDNGSGKSTILRIACGLVSPDGGVARIFGGDPATDGRARARIAAMFDGGRALYARLTPAENAAYFACMKGFDKRRAMQRFEALSARFAIRHYEQVVVRKLSRGTQQKFALVSALATGADLWLLDEPTLGMDDASVAILAALVKEHLEAGGSTLMATHDMAFAAALGEVIRVADFLVADAQQAPVPAGNIDIDLSRAREGSGI